MSAMQRIIGLLMLLCCASFTMRQALAAEEIVYYHVNALGSPVAATDQSGQVMWREAYSPFGERIKYEDNGQNKLWFTGKPHDETTGLTYFGARWYDPVVGRFMAVDPVSFRENSIYSFNRYAYANNNPYKYVDPDGEVSIAVGAVVVVGLWVVSDIVLPSLGPQPAFDSGVVERAGFPIDAGIIKGTIGAARLGISLTRGLRGVPKGAGSSPHINPRDVANKTPGQIDALAKEKGLIPKGPNPQAGKGAYVDPATGNQRVLCHTNCADPHAHVNNPQGQRLDVNGNAVPPESPAAHLPVDYP